MSSTPTLSLFSLRLMIHEILTKTFVCYGRTDQRTNGRTNGPTDQRTNGPTKQFIEMRRSRWTHLKNECIRCNMTGRFPNYSLSNGVQRTEKEVPIGSTRRKYSVSARSYRGHVHDRGDVQMASISSTCLFFFFFFPRLSRAGSGHLREGFPGQFLKSWMLNRGCRNALK